MTKKYDLDEIFSYHGWDKLYDILHGATYQEVVDMLIASGCSDFDEEQSGDYRTIWVYGYYCDRTPIIRFEKEVVVCWHRQGRFD